MSTNISGKPKSSVPCTLQVVGRMITSPQIICDKINDHFVKIGEKLNATLTTSNKLHYKNFLGKRQTTSIMLKPTDEYEIAGNIASLDIHKSSGYIDIPVTLIKESKFLIARYLANVFNECMVSGFYPDIFKIAKVIPLHKGGSTLDLCNYRPISILSPINKIFETIIHKRLVDYWKSLTCLPLHNLASEEIIRPTLLSLTYTKKYFNSVMKINWFAASF